MHETSLIAYKSGTYSFVFKMEREFIYEIKLWKAETKLGLGWIKTFELKQTIWGRGRLGVPIMGIDLKSVAMVLPIPTTSLCSALYYSEVGKAYQTIKIWICLCILFFFLILDWWCGLFLVQVLFFFLWNDPRWEYFFLRIS